MSDRFVALVLEATGPSPDSGDRLTEVAAVEIVKGIPTDQTLHLRPQNPEGAAAAVDDLVAFCAGSGLVSHFAAFDAALLRTAARPGVEAPHISLDTHAAARRRFPNLPNSLEAIASRAGLPLVSYTPDALGLASLLANVAVELGLPHAGPDASRDQVGHTGHLPAETPGQAVAPRRGRQVVLSDEELAAHAAFLSKIKDPIWAKIVTAADASATS